MNVSYTVQHHPARAELLPRLLPHLPGARVVPDPDPDGIPNPWRSYQACLRHLPPDATHLAVVQDDALPVEGFHPRVEAIATEKPDSIVCLFVSAAPQVRVAMTRALRDGEPWARLNPQGFLPCVATIFPREIVVDLRRWASALPAKRHRRSDDYMLSMFARARRLEVWACVPSIVGHDDDTPSLIGSRSGQRHRQAVALASIPRQTSP